MRIAIDASSIQAGGGMTHLSELLNAAQPARQGIESVAVFGSGHTLQRLPRKPWLRAVPEPMLDRRLPHRLFWQRFVSARSVRRRCDILLVPGGTYSGSFEPFVTMSQNLLPFEPSERRRFGLSWPRVRYTLLEKSQGATFRRANGLIFLTRTARETVERRTGSLPGQVAIVPHGIAERFRQEPRAQRPLSEYSPSRPFRWLYVSIVNLYKHQWHVSKAVAALRGEGLPLTIDLVGPAYAPALRGLREVLEVVDPAGDFIRYHGQVAHSEVADWYHSADGFVFASSCENMPIILLEAMASGLPIASSDRGPMPEVLGDAGVYFGPEDPRSIAEALHSLMEDASLREQYAWAAYRRAQQYSWERCARETFSFLAQVARGPAI